MDVIIVLFLYQIPDQGQNKINFNSFSERLD